MAWYKHQRGRENETVMQIRDKKVKKKSRVCIAIENSPNPSSVYIVGLVRKLLRHRGGKTHAIWELNFVQESRNCVVVPSREADRVCR